MATSRTFNAMLNEYLAYDLLMEEYAKKDYLMGQLKKRGLIDTGWKGGTLIVPFQGACATSVKYGSLTADTDLDEFEYVRGSISDYKEAWGTMFWHSRDLREHNGRVPEDSFVKNLLKQVDHFTDYMKEIVSINLLNGSYIAKSTAAATAADGVVTVDHPERFVLGQRIKIDDETNNQTGYVTNIDINTKKITLKDARSSGTALDFSGGADQDSGSKLYIDGADSDAFTDLPAQLLSATNGGSTNLFGKAKVNYPFLQAWNESGSAITASNILEKLFDAQTNARQYGKGNPDTLLMSYKHLGSVMKKLEDGSGAYRHIETRANPYGYTEVVIGGVKGNLTLVGIHEMNDDNIIGLDWRAIKFHTNEGFKKEVDPDGNVYYKTRATTGYKYICDIGLYGEFVVNMPSHCFIIHSISY